MVQRSTSGMRSLSPVPALATASVCLQLCLPRVFQLRPGAGGGRGADERYRDEQARGLVLLDELDEDDDEIDL